MAQQEITIGGEKRPIKRNKRTRYLVVLRSKTTGEMLATYRVFGIGHTPEVAKQDAQALALAIFQDMSFSPEDVVRHPMGNGPLPKKRAVKRTIKAKMGKR